MLKLFENTSLKGMALKNRLVRSATDEGMADENGFPTEKLFRLYRRLAKGGVGLLITGFTYVDKGGRPIFPGTLGIDSDDHIEAYAKLVDMVHANGAKIAMQIAHSGRQTTKERLGGMIPVAPSPVTDHFYGTTPRQMTDADIVSIIEAFGRAALRAKQSGFDAVQVHCAHGYLLHSFICPYTNRREGKWGGSLQNRLGIVQQVYDCCREKVGEAYPLLVKYSAWDRMDTGVQPAEGVKIGVRLAQMGFDGIEVSCGLVEDGGSTLLGEAQLGEPLKQGYNRESAAALKQKVEVPVFLVGGLTDPNVMEAVLTANDADYICLSRALISDAAFPSKIDEKEMAPARCIQCSLCMLHLNQAPLRCYFGKPLKIVN